MRHLSYILTCTIIGLTLGGIFGLVFDSFYTKKSQRESKQTIQVYLFGVIGTIAGAFIGYKLAEDAVEAKRKQKEYEDSLVTKQCQVCANHFTFSTQEYNGKIYCDDCITQISQDYIQKCSEFNKIANGIEDLKMKAAIQKRIDKLEDIANSLMKYENIELSIIQEKPSFILKKVKDFKATKC